MKKLLMLAMLLPLTGNAYDICFVGDNGPQCFALVTDRELKEVVNVVPYDNGDLEVSFLGVDVDLRCKDTDRDGFDEECTIAISEDPDEQYFPNGTVMSAECRGSTLIETVANGFGVTYTRPTINAEQCGYVGQDPCYSGSWYTGYGNPLCEDPTGTDTSPSYREVCPANTSPNYILLDLESCL